MNGRVMGRMVSAGRSGVQGHPRTARESRSGAWRRLGAASGRLSRRREEGLSPRRRNREGAESLRGLRSGRLRWFGEPAVARHLPEEDQLVHLSDRPVGVTDRDAGEIRREVSGLVRRQTPHDQLAVGRLDGLFRQRRRSRRRRGVDVRPRRDRGGRRGASPGRADARRSSRSPCPSGRLTCHGSPGPVPCLAVRASCPVMAHS
jgi:hypothetical protein